jgi:hypothetical protein
MIIYKQIVGISNILRIYFEPYNNPKNLTHIRYFNNKAERLLFISGLKYNKNIQMKYIKIYLYSIKDLERYLEILNLLNTDEKYTYNKNEMIKFFEG